MPVFELLNILKIMCEVICNPHEGMKFDSHIIEASNSPHCRTNIASQNNIKWMQLILMQTCQIISGPVPTKQQIK